MRKKTREDNARILIDTQFKITKKKKMKNGEKKFKNT